MYADYAKLWKLLLEKKLTKTELCEMTGISTRTISKLVKNQSVTTDTLLRICEVLNCDLSDILEISREEPNITVFEAYKQKGKLIAEDEYHRMIEFEHNGKIFKVKEIKKNVTKRMMIHCKANDTVVREQLYPSGHTVLSEMKVISNLSFVESGKICILLIGGNCDGITGLDKGRFLSYRQPYSDGKVYVMTKAKFKLFVLSEMNEAVLK